MTTSDNTTRPATEDEPCGPCSEAKSAEGGSHRWADLALGVLAVGFGVAIIVMGFDLASGGTIAKLIGVAPDASGE